MDWLRANVALDRFSDPSQIVIFPDGDIATADDHPLVMSQAIADKLIARFNERGNKVPVDYEHASVVKAAAGEAAKAVGWVNHLNYAPGVGLIGSVEWSDEAKAHIVKKEYKYLSPAWQGDPETGEPTLLLSVALTNQPRINNMRELVAASLVVEKTNVSKETKTASIEPFAPLRDAAVTAGICTQEASDTELVAAILKKVQTTEPTTDTASIAAKLGLDQKAKPKEITDAIDKLHLSRVPSDEFASLKRRADDLETWKKDHEKAEKDRATETLVASFVAQGKLNPKDEDAMKRAKQLATSDAEAFTAFMASVKPVFPVGQIVDPTAPKRDTTVGTSRTRVATIQNARTEWGDGSDPCFEGLTLASFVNGKLLEARQKSLSTDEATALCGATK